MPNYINKKEFHQEMVNCKKSDKLSNRAITYFQLMANEISKTYYFQHHEDRNDAKARAVLDCYKYWRGFKESNVVQISFDRNFAEHDKIVVDILGGKGYVFVASHNPVKPNEFLISDTINRSLKSLMMCINDSHKDDIEAFLDTIKKKLTIMDRFNQDDLTRKSRAVIIRGNGAELKETRFENPPNAFCYYTSTVRNGILKLLNEINSKVHKPANRISLTSFNDHQQRFYNL